MVTASAVNQPSSLTKLASSLSSFCDDFKLMILTSCFKKFETTSDGVASHYILFGISRYVW
jgi:hypothetical protein